MVDTIKELYICSVAMKQQLNLTLMNSFIDILNNPNEITENDFCIINLKTSEITWKPNKFNPKVQADVMYWLSKRNFVEFN